MAAAPADVTVAVEPPPPVPRLARVGPFEVAAGSRAGLIATLAIGLVAIAGLAAWVAVLALRARRVRGG